MLTQYILSWLARASEPLIAITKNFVVNNAMQARTPFQAFAFRFNQDEHGSE
jgi:hypothetical protein